MQEPQPFGYNFSDEDIDAGCVASRPSKASNKTQLDWVFTDGEDDGDRGSRSFGRNRNSGVAGRGDDGHAATYEVSYKRRQAFVLAVEPMIFHRDILVLEIARFVKPLPKRNRTAGGVIG